MRHHPETGPDHTEGDEREIEIIPKEMSDAEYKAGSLKGHDEARMTVERELMMWQEAYEERKKEGLTDEQRKQYEDKVENLKKQIALAAKEKAEVEAAFEESERKKTA